MEAVDDKCIMFIELKNRKYKNQLLKGIKGIYVDMEPTNPRSIRIV